MKAGLITWEERISGALQDFDAELAIQSSLDARVVRRAVERLLEHPAYLNRLTAIISNDSGGIAFPHFRE